MFKLLHLKSLTTKITFFVVCVATIMTVVSTLISVISINNIGNENTERTLKLLCETGQKNLDSYFNSVEHSVDIISSYLEDDLSSINYLSEDQLESHLDRAKSMFEKVSNETAGVLTYYYRIDPSISTENRGFWYVNLNQKGFEEHEPTDLSLYDLTDTSHVVWFTVPKNLGQPVWQPPYFTENLDIKVISYNVPIYYNDQFIGVAGIELDYRTMAEQVDNIKLFKSGYAFINDDEGTIIYHPNIDVFELTPETSPKVPDGLLSNSSYISYTFEGIPKLAVWRKLSNGMKLNVTVPVSEINSDWHLLINVILGVFFILLLVVILITMKLTGHITKPLNDLTEVAKKVNDGNYDINLTYDKDDEVGILTRAFKTLINHLKEYIGDLSNLAYADALTHVHNKGAFDIYVKEMYEEIETDENFKFAICMFDCNDLKEINDQYGHEHGDLYLKNSCDMICRVLKRSPVFRIGGDEFVSVLQGADYKNRNSLIREFDESCKATFKKKNPWDRIDVARGLAVYNRKTDISIENVIHRADMMMYENKNKRKEENI